MCILFLLKLFCNSKMSQTFDDCNDIYTCILMNKKGRLNYRPGLHQTRRLIKSNKNYKMQMFATGKNIIEQLIAIFPFLSKQCLHFCGKCDKLYFSNNGNILKLVQLIARFDSDVPEHLMRVVHGLAQHSLGKTFKMN